MKNEKVILLSGFARGGSNIVWNILQSHPDIVAPTKETGQIFKKSVFLRTIHTLDQMGISGFYPGYRLKVDDLLFQRKMDSMPHAYNRYRSPDELYSEEQMANSTLCLKSVNKDIAITPLLVKIYPDLHFIGLVRNGYSLADGYIRRNVSAKKAGRIYRQMAESMQEISTLVDNFKVIKFEDVLKDPFGISRQLFSFTGVQPTELTQLRLKSKKVVSDSGEHKVIFGEENQKHWFTRDTIGQVVDRNIDQRQKGRLTSADFSDFNQEASEAMKYFGYAVKSGY